ncbi:PulJ/GspJ family protein [Oligoflexus tunisiensis]|uniref:PulJ/GspJ family protein n=1 Tax=Oligoflexus tunisiensis TaxID=708132 RepID=UPI00114C91EE|nr:prepilin-type N-terminal cleavage/methylation domain-containing protein [Oligoflexus tunisiensis]
MRLINARHKESGLTLVEMTISLAITSLIAVGGYKMMVRSQKYLAQKQMDQSSKTEIEQFLTIAKKDWDFRSRGQIPAVPPSGHALLTATNNDCPVNTKCPKLRLWIQRKINNAPVNVAVTIENTCRRPTEQRVIDFVSNLSYVVAMEEGCSTCPKGEIPSLRIEGLNMVDNAIVLAAENRIFPQNALQLGRVNTNGVLGMQACFSQTAIDSPLSVDVRSMVIDQSSSALKVARKTQVYPFENFANIQLEQ